MILFTDGYLGLDDRQPLKNPRIAHHTLSFGATYSASGTVSGYPAINLQDPMTLNRWRADSSPTSLTATFDSSTISYVAMAAHNLDGVEVGLEVNGVSVYSYTPSDNRPIIIIFEEVDATSIELTFTHSKSFIELGVLYFGKILDMPRPIYGGHTPAVLNRNTVTKPRRSESGQFLSKTIVRKGYSADVSLRHLEPDFYRDRFDEFVMDARLQPFFFAWRPGDYPGEVVYGWSNDDIAPSNMGIRGLMEVSFSMECFDE